MSSFLLVPVKFYGTTHIVITFRGRVGIICAFKCTVNTRNVDKTIFRVRFRGQCTSDMQPSKESTSKSEIRGNKASDIIM